MKPNSIELSGYELHREVLNPYLHFLRRSQFRREKEIVRDIYVGFWMLYHFDLPPGKLSVVHKGEKTNLDSSMLLFVPSMRPIEWHFEPGLTQWTSFSCVGYTEKWFPTEPMMMKWDRNRTWDADSDVFSIIQEINRSGSLLSTEKISYVAAKTQSFLHSHFSENVPIVDIAKDIKISHSTMTHGFKNYFGIPIVEYRNLLRIFDSLKRLANGETAKEASFNAGHRDYSRFYRNFSETIGCAPRYFIVKK